MLIGGSCDGLIGNGIVIVGTMGVGDCWHVWDQDGLVRCGE